MRLDPNFISKFSMFKNTKFNQTLALNLVGVTELANAFSAGEGVYKNFSDEVSNLFVLPVRTLSYVNIGKLWNSRGVFNTIVCRRLDPNCLVQSVGQKYIAPYYNNFLDYKGYTYIKVYLPFLGIVDVDVDECMGKWLQVVVSIDVATGGLTYYLGVSDNVIGVNITQPYVASNKDFENVRFFATFECSCAINIPLGRSNAEDIKRNNIMNVLRTASTIAIAATTHSIPVSTTTTTTAPKTTTVQSRGTEPYSRMKTTKISTTEGGSKTSTTYKPYNIGDPISEIVDCSIDILNRNVPAGNSDRPNNVSSMFALSTKVQIAIYRPKVCNDYIDYKTLIGKPVGISSNLGSFQGLTVLSKVRIDLNDFPPFITKDELNELEAILLSSKGVILYGQVEQLSTFKLKNNVDNGILSTYNFISGYNWDMFINSPYNINKHFIVGTEIFDDDYRVLYKYGDQYKVLRDFSGAEVYNNDMVSTSTYNISF